MPEPVRLDIAMTKQGLTVSRSRAQAIVAAGGVFVNGHCCRKASYLVKEADTIEIRSGESRFVSRGGYKLLKAVNEFSLSFAGMVCMDVGASTGGFTDCMLQYGARRVYTIDVGTDQLAACLRQDARVICREQCNFRYITKDEIPEPIDFASVDVSFISLDKIIPVLYNLLSINGQAVCLIKPQFEAGRSLVGKNGVVRDPAVHLQVLQQVTAAMQQQGFFIKALTYSPIKGPQGNIEYLALLCKKNQPILPIPLQQVVQAAHKELDCETP